MSALDDTMDKFSALLADGDEPPAILPLAAASRLREALPAIREVITVSTVPAAGSISIRSNFSVGDVVRQRPGFRATRYPTREVPGIFVRYLLPEEREWDEPSGTNDCIVACIVHDALVVYRIVSWRLEIYPEGEL